ncbi:MAG: EscU/YscU/HrcU family type III secretion system export apparatus switch protein [Paraperlucidibaca sp.]
MNKPNQAIALHYDGQRAPRVTAKGEAEVAERILALAHEHNVPIHEDIELTSLLAQVELDDEIPLSLFVAIAEVLAFTYRLKGKSPAPQTSTRSSSYTTI